jgi:rhamnosyltransferase
MTEIGHICAVVVTFNPAVDFPDNLSSLSTQVNKVFVVDNSNDIESQSAITKLQSGHISVITNRKNLGIAAALNIGCRKARDEGFQWVLTMDQDSMPGPEMVKTLSLKLSCHPDQSNIATIGPDIIEEGDDEKVNKWLKRSRFFPIFYSRVTCDLADNELLEDVTFTITSGALLNLELWETLGCFKEELFIDYVDIEYCLRSIQHGYKNLVCCSAKLFHHIGKRKKFEVLGHNLSPTHHPPSRIYYMYRNKIFMYRNYALSFPHWLMFDVFATFYQLVRIVVAEEQKVQKIRHAFLGMIDGFKGFSQVS